MYSVLVSSNQTDYLACILGLSMCLQVFNAGIDNILGLKWDNGTIWVINMWVSIWVSIVSTQTIGVCAIGTVDSTVVSIVETKGLESKVGSCSSRYFWGGSYTLNTIGVDDGVGAGNSSRGEEGSQELHV